MNNNLFIFFCSKATLYVVYDIYICQPGSNLKGIIIYRDGCKRSGIVLNDKKDRIINKEKIEMKYDIGKMIQKKNMKNLYAQSVMMNP